MIFKELANKIVLVIGGYQGIGKAVVNSYLNEKAIVIDTDYRYDTGLKKINDYYYQLNVDIRSEDSIKQLFQDLATLNLNPEILVHVAGISTMDFLVDSKTEDFDKVFAVNTRGAYLVLKHFTKQAIDNNIKARIIVVSSQAAKNGYRAMSSYVASKHAVNGLVKNLALEVAKNGILVNAVCPGIIETEMKHRERVEGGALRKMSAQEVLAEDISQVPLLRTGQPSDVANVILFLSSDLSSYITGQAINVTGGMTMH